MFEVNKAIESLSKNFQSAIQAGETELAKSIQDKIDSLIEYSTKIPAKKIGG